MQFFVLNVTGQKILCAADLWQAAKQVNFTWATLRWLRVCNNIMYTKSAHNLVLYFSHLLCALI